MFLREGAFSDCEFEVTMVNEFDPVPNIVRFSELEPLGFNNSCITIGNFDGVHRGHQAIINCMIRNAKPQNRPVIVVTFYPNPADFFNPEVNSFYLSSPEEKEARLLEIGVDSVITFKFNRDFANLTPREFLSGLTQKLGLDVLVIGQDFALGKNRQGTLPVIKELGRDLGYKVEVIRQVNLEDEKISSTNIRQCLDEGDVICAAEMLGRYYSVAGLVTHGSDRGTRIGLPTANMTHWSHKKLPAVGVYATIVDILGERHRGITNVGYRPTFEDQQQTSIETHILDFDGNIYGERIEVAFLQKIRDEQKFPSVEAFLSQIERDKITARRIFRDDEIKTHLSTQP